jgi:hypothetical protein
VAIVQTGRRFTLRVAVAATDFAEHACLRDERFTWRLGGRAWEKPWLSATEALPILRSFFLRGYRVAHGGAGGDTVIAQLVALGFAPRDHLPLTASLVA